MSAADDDGASGESTPAARSARRAWVGRGDATRFPAMELRIGVVHTAKELTIELDGSADDVIAGIDRRARGRRRPMVWVTDAKGRRVGIPADKIAYVEIDEDGAAKRVGFGR